MKDGSVKTGILTILLLALSSASLSETATAGEFDREGVRGDTYCFPAKFAVDLIKKFSNVKPSKTDVVAINMKPQFLIYDGGNLPDRYYLKRRDGSEAEFSIATDGAVPDFLSKVASAGKKDDLCIDDKARAGLDADDESLYFEMGLTPYFHNTSGAHTLAELQEGAKDGRSLYKKMIPGAVRMFMPSTSHLSVKPANANTRPTIVALKDGVVLGTIDTVYYNEAYVFSCDVVEDMGADSIRIEGGPYRMAPVPSIKTMKKYGIGKPRGPKTKQTNTQSP